MGDDDWGFLLDENIERAVGTCLRDHGYRVDHVVSVLEPGVDDLTAVLPYARAEDLIVVTKDVSDFSALNPEDHEGLILINSHRLTATEMCAAVRQIVSVYSSRDALRDHFEFPDQWIE
jgi:predicted nuclease of predicted toxin-antitoxin system